MKPRNILALFSIAYGCWILTALAQERELPRCPHVYCPQLVPVAPSAQPLLICTGSEVEVCAEVTQIPGCYQGEDVEFRIRDKDWTWEVSGFDAEPSEGRGPCAVFISKGIGRGQVIFTIRAKGTFGRMRCEDEKEILVPVWSHVMRVALSPTNHYLGLDGYDPPARQAHFLTATAWLAPEYNDLPYEWGLSGVCEFEPTGNERTRRIVDTGRASDSYNAERVTAHKICEGGENFTVVRMDVDAGLSEVDEEKEGFIVPVNNNDSDGSGMRDCDEQPVATADPDLIPVTIRIYPENIPASDIIAVYCTSTFYEDPYKITRGKNQYTVGDLPLKLYIESRTPSSAARQEIIAARHVPSEARDCARFTAVQVDIGMDGNRDGQIDFTNPKDREYLFWVNDDCDMKRWNEGMWQQDDFDPSGQPDCEDDRIGRVENSSDGGCERDLEDFTRLHIRVSHVLASMPGISYWLKFEDITSGSPSINVFEAIDETMLFLSDPYVAALQINKQSLTSTGVGTQEVPIDEQYIKKNNQVSAFIIEGRTAGRGALTFIVKKDNCEIARSTVTLELHEMPWFYDIYRVAVRSGIRWETDVTETATHDQVASYVPRTEDKFLLVHGWNMNEFEKKAWIETAFKRLWWQGYQGSVALFNWPTLSDMNFWDVLTGAHHFDNSEFRAWSSADGLIGVVQTLNQGGRLRVLAHSMGNIVVGEALRRYAGPNVHTYIACQAALSAQYYDNTVAARAACRQQGWDPSFPDTPDIMGYFPTGDTNSGPYILTENIRVSNMHNYFNPDDWALAWWEVNNVLKPDGLTPYLFGYFGSKDCYREGVDRFSRGPLINPYEVLSVTNQRQCFMIFSYCAESRSRALGQTENGELTGWDLQTNLRYDDRHYSHSRQFRSDIANEWNFWFQVFRTCNFRVP